ncbi:MAG: DNA adenine methylase [Bacteroidales bacterium]|nr:DNA adenine methylase [Bacteroidales bacterium]
MENKANSHRSPLRYPGGKACIFKFMTKLLEENDLVGTDYAEPYAGGAGLALKLMMEEYVGDIYINDLDPSIYAFWNVILTRPEDFCKWIEKVPVTVEQWLYYKQIQSDYKTADSFELAKSTFFLNRTNVSGVITGGIIGGLKQEGKYKIDVRFNKQDLINRIQSISNFSKRIHLYNMDGVDFVKELERMKRSIFIYLDPPYYKKGSDLYMNAFHDDDHQLLASKVKKLNKKWIISYDNQDFIIQLYKEEPKVLYQLSQCTSNRIGDEVIIFDKRLQRIESMHNLNNAIAV